MNTEEIIIKINFRNKYTYRVINIAELDNRLKLINPFDDHVLACKEDIEWYMRNIFSINHLEVYNIDEILKEVNQAIERYQAVTYGIYFNR